MIEKYFKLVDYTISDLKNIKYELLNHLKCSYKLLTT